ncbi:cell envelope opacity-associated protein A [Enterobacteriaceae bacterium YMB-R22]|jgi:cell envelope opacity-associated protein A|uniref:LysM-like peptidoglycan-binding domain-containing protein n=1 Tax=Tenebrionicola larvae TaxID=2815733 RepID=UPI0020112F6E|nr:LysM-like peptidoglycan-binding domain-containing protein [Tenebrionicola larvae]MBV4413594.1 cell envelope opacity-associated protein A [Tenebrionicola larvae]
MPTRFIVKTFLARAWQAPEHIRLMDPLPPMHRRGIILGVLLVVIGVLMPSPEERKASMMRDMLNRFLPTPPAEIAPTDLAPVPFQGNDIEQRWRAYRIGRGKTLLQMFRENHLPTADVYAMTQVEGSDKPLSNLQSGQIVRIRQNASGVITGLTIEGGNNPVLFARQPNGRFMRVN